MASTLTSAQQRRVLFFSVGAALLYGGWATFANRGHGLSRAGLSGVAQGMMSLLSTALLTTAMERLFHALSPGPRRFLLAALGPMWIVVLLMVAVHWLVGTPEILRTILPSLLIGTLFSLSYTLGLTRLESKKQANKA